MFRKRIESVFRVIYIVHIPALDLHGCPSARSHFWNIRVQGCQARLAAVDVLNDWLSVGMFW